MRRVADISVAFLTEKTIGSRRGIPPFQIYVCITEYLCYNKVTRHGKASPCRVLSGIPMTPLSFFCRPLSVISSFFTHASYSFRANRKKSDLNSHSNDTRSSSFLARWWRQAAQRHTADMSLRCNGTRILQMEYQQIFVPLCLKHPLLVLGCRGCVFRSHITPASRHTRSSSFLDSGTRSPSRRCPPFNSSAFLCVTLWRK